MANLMPCNGPRYGHKWICSELERLEKETRELAMVAHLPRELLARALPSIVMVPAPEEREEYLRLMMNAMPAAAFQGVAATVKAGIPADAWADLAARVPELEG